MVTSRSHSHQSMLEHFRTYGWDRIFAAFSADAAAVMRDVVSAALAKAGIRRDDPSTLTPENDTLGVICTAEHFSRHRSSPPRLRPPPRIHPRLLSKPTATGSTTRLPSTPSCSKSSPP